jgi:hypothetical protein
MRRAIFSVGPDWPPNPAAYDYMSLLAKPDWAWEYLRRNSNYQSIARLRRGKGLVHVRLTNGASLTRLRARSTHAEAWGLCCFR